MRPASSYYSIYDRSSLIRIIRRIHRQKGDLSWTGIRNARPDVLAATHYHFGSWRRAVYAAGINYKLEKRVRNWEWDRERVREALLRCRRRGEPMNYNDFERRHRKLIHVALYYFRTWRAALASIGVDHDKVRKQRQWDVPTILREIGQLHRQGKDLSHRHLSQAGRNDLLGAASHHLGGWPKAIERAGLDYSRIRKRRQWSREKIVRIIRQLHREKQDVSASGMHRSGNQAVVRAAPWHFRNWGVAVTAAGLDYRKIKKPAGTKRIARRSRP